MNANVSRNDWVPTIVCMAGVWVFPSSDLVSLDTSAKLSVDSLTTSSFLMIGEKCLAKFLSWVCFKFLFLNLYARWSSFVVLLIYAI